MGNKIVIAVDGPAGAGKSTVAKIIASRLNIEYVDSGALYRSITKKILDSKIKIDDYTAIDRLLDILNIQIENQRVFINGEDLSDFIRTKEVTDLVSPVSSNVQVRLKVNSFLNEYSGSKSIIMDGRDIGTVVFPDADYKFYLDASVDMRANRRFNEGIQQGTIDEIKSSIENRDKNDKNKSYGALKQAEDAIYIDTTSMSIDQVVEYMLDIINFSGVEDE